MSDSIRIAGLRAEARVGVTELERSRPQPVRIDIELLADLSVAASSDDLGDTVDYDGAARKVGELVKGGEFRLLEHLAQRIIEQFAGESMVKAVTVEVSKTELELDEDVDAVSVRLTRSVR